jgi:t-SNARE complex subunit (syntaxin)
MPEHTQTSAKAVGQSEQFAVSEHEFLDKLSSEDSNRIRERLDDMSTQTRDLATSATELGKEMLTELEAFARRQPISAMIGALVLGIFAGMCMRK